MGSWFVAPTEWHPRLGRHTLSGLCILHASTDVVFAEWHPQWGSVHLRRFGVDTTANDALLRLLVYVNIAQAWDTYCCNLTQLLQT